MCNLNLTNDNNILPCIDGRCNNYYVHVIVVVNNYCMMLYEYCMYCRRHESNRWMHVTGGQCEGVRGTPIFSFGRLPADDNNDVLL